MPEITSKTVFDILLESLKIQAEKYKTLIESDLTHDERKEFDSEIKQMYELLSSMTNSTIILSSAEIETLKTDFEKKLQEFQLILDNPNLTIIKGDNGKSAYQIALENGFQGTETEWLKSLNGKDGNSLTYNDLTQEQKDSLKGADGKDFTFNMLTSTQLQQIANLVSVDLTSIQNKIKSIEDVIASLGGSVTPPASPTYFYPKPFVPSTDYFFNSEDYVYSLSFAHYADELVENWGNDETPDFHSIVRQYFTYFQAFGITSFIRVKSEITVSDGLSENPSKKIVFVNNSRILPDTYEIVNDSSVIFSENNGSTNTLPEVNIFTLALDSTPSKEIMVEFHKDNNNVLEPFAVDFLGTDKLFYHVLITVSSTIPPLDVSALAGSGAYATSYYVPSEPPL